MSVSAGCVDGLKGSNLEIDFSPNMPVETSVGLTPGPGEIPADTHFTLYAVSSSGSATSLFAVTAFEVHHIVDLESPCYIDVDEHAAHPGLHVSEYAAAIAQDVGFTDLANPPATATQAQIDELATAERRMANVQLLAGASGLRAVTSASAGNYPPVGSDCNDTSGIPPPTCIDDASNARRLAACQDAWSKNPDYYEGTDLVLTSPLNGTNHGLVDGQNPVNLSPVGGAGFFVDDNLAGFDTFAIYQQADDQTSIGSDLILYGTGSEVTRGVTHVNLATPATGALTAELAIFVNLGEDNEQF